MDANTFRGPLSSEPSRLMEENRKTVRLELCSRYIMEYTIDAYSRSFKNKI